MKKAYLYYVIALAISIASGAVLAQTMPVTSATVANFTFKPMCTEDGCTKPPPPGIKPKNWCIVANSGAKKINCIPLESNKISGIFPKPNVMHWRVYPNGKMAQFQGEVQITPRIPTQMPLIEAKPDQIQSSPVIGVQLKDGQTIYWVKTKLSK